MFNMKRIGARISRLRKEKDITQMELSEKLGISYQAVSNWERGISMPDISKLPELARVFSVSIDEIIGDEPGSKVVVEVIRDNLEEYVRNNTIGMDEILNLGPILKESQTTELIKNLEMTKENLIDIAPYVLNDVIEDYLINDDEVFSQIEELLPFLSEEFIYNLAIKNINENKMKHINLFAPFMDEKNVEKIGNEILKNGSMKDILGLIPYYKDSSVKKLAEVLLTQIIE